MKNASNNVKSRNESENCVTASTLLVDDNVYDSLVESLEEYNFSSTPISSLVYTKENPNYSNVLQSGIRNLRFNTPTTPKPLLVITPFHPSHVQGIVKWARKSRLQMKIRSGGHDYEGLSYVSNTPFFVLDMVNLRSVDVNLDEETAWVQSGATLGEVFYRISKKSRVHGFPAGVCPSVGVGGHISGAGYGNMMRKYGLASDNVVDAEIVDANGRLLNRQSMGEDLFWAIRGGGGASFGVILSYKINLVRVPEIVTVFRVSRTMEENAVDIVLQWQDISSTIDDNLFLRLTMDVVDQDETKGNKTVRATFIALFLGNLTNLLPLITDKFSKLGLRSCDCQELSWIESVLFWADYSPTDTSIDVLLERKPRKLSHLARKSDYVKEPIPREGLEYIWKKMIELETPMLTFNPYGGRMGEISEDYIPFPHRKGVLYKIQYLVNWDDEGKEEEDYYMELLRKLYIYMSPYVSKHPRQAYYNYRDLDLGINQHDGTKGFLEGSKYGVPYFINNFDKLVKIKTLVDPCNFFHNEQSIPPLFM